MLSTHFFLLFLPAIFAVPDCESRGIRTRHVLVTFGQMLLIIWQAAYKPNFVEDDHSSRRHITVDAHSDLPAGLARRASMRFASLRRKASRLFGLAPCGVYHASGFTAGAVRSYRTFSPLPHPFRDAAVFSLWHLPSRSLDAPVPDVIRHTALRSSDFPLPTSLSNSPAAIAQPPAILMIDAKDGEASWETEVTSIFP